MTTRSLASLVPAASASSLRQATSRPIGARPQFVHGNKRSFGTNCNALAMLSATSSGVSVPPPALRPCSGVGNRR